MPAEAAAVVPMARESWAALERPDEPAVAVWSAPPLAAPDGVTRRAPTDGDRDAEEEVETEAAEEAAGAVETRAAADADDVDADGFGLEVDEIVSDAEGDGAFAAVTSALPLNGRK
ncbi:hypothetical protein [Streptomyces sp. NPDC088400]|uniref:hypothetical protein n=1 Tax=Streptomyces sp. NPDC088400 TaxID=3365861 RepID=UPI00380D0500